MSCEHGTLCVVITLSSKTCREFEQKHTDLSICTVFDTKCLHRYQLLGAADMQAAVAHIECGIMSHVTV